MFKFFPVGSSKGLIAGIGVSLFTAVMFQAQGQDLGKQEKTIVLKGHRDKVIGLAFSPDGKMLASGSIDGTIKLWDLPTGKNTLTINAFSLGCRGPVIFSPDGKILLSCGIDIDNDMGLFSCVKLWDVASGKYLRFIGDPFESAEAIALSPDGKILASGGGGNISLFNLSTGKKLTSLEQRDTPGPRVSSLVFSPDGKFLVSGKAEQGVRPRPQPGRAFIPAANPGTVNLWDLATGQSIANFTAHGGVEGNALVVNFGLVERFPTRFYTYLIKVREETTGRNVRLVVCCIRPEHQEILRLYNASKLFTFTDTEERAVELAKEWTQHKG